MSHSWAALAIILPSYFIIFQPDELFRKCTLRKDTFQQDMINLSFPDSFCVVST